MTRPRRVLAGIAVALVAVGTMGAAVATLPEYLWDYLFVLTPTQYGDVVSATTAAAVRVGVFWALSAALLGAIALRLDRTMDLGDAVLAGALGVWIVAFLAGNVLGPLGLMTSAVVWAVVLATGVVVAALGPPAIPWRRPTAGEWLLLVAFVLIAPGLLAIQLGAPLVPFMDVLATPASAQRVLTFGRYEPLDSDPYGYWDAGSQCPAAELLFAWLGLGAGVPHAVLGQTAAIVPLAALLLLAVQRLGRAVAGDVAGGFAALFLLATVLFRVLPYGHGRTITYVLGAAGLAWFCERPGSPVRRVLAGLALATAVGSHAVVGALAMGVAALSVVLDAADLGVRRTAAAIGLLAGASLVAFPEVVVGIRLAVPYPGVPLVQLLGIGLLVPCARAFAGDPPHRRLALRVLRWALVALLLWAATRTPPLVGGLQDHLKRFPVLFVGGTLGLAVLAWRDRGGRSTVRLAPVVAALLLGMAAEKGSAEYWQTFADPRVRIAVQGFYRKVDYWYPFVWAVPAGAVAACVARWVSRPVAALAVLAVLCLPWNPDADPNYHQQSLAAGWAQQAALAKGGYWGSMGHRRWGQTEAELALARVLRAEVEAGRIRFDTHVTHVEPYVMLYQDAVLFSVYTGINDDTYIVEPWEPDISNVGGRVFPRRELADALARRPPYLVVHERTRNNRALAADVRAMLAEALADYEEIFADDGVRLLRRPDLSPAPP